MRSGFVLGLVLVLALALGLCLDLDRGPGIPEYALMIVGYVQRCQMGPESTWERIRPGLIKRRISKRALDVLRCETEPVPLLSRCVVCLRILPWVYARGQL